MTGRYTKISRLRGTLPVKGLLVEVLSESTEAYDRGEKFAHYMRVPSLRAYILVAQTQRRIEVFHRPQTRGHWQQDVFEADDAMLLHGGSIPLDEIYGA